MSTSLFTDVRTAFSKAIEPFICSSWKDEAKGPSKLNLRVQQAADAVTRSILKHNRTDKQRIHEWHKVVSDGPFLESLVKATVTEKLNLSPEKPILYNTHFEQDLKLDPNSDEKHRLYNALEQRFDVFIDDKQIFRTFGALVDFLKDAFTKRK